MSVKAAIHKETMFSETVSGNNVSSCMIQCFRAVSLFRVYRNLFPANRQPLYSSETVSTKIKEAVGPVTSGQHGEWLYVLPALPVCKKRE